MANRVKLFIDWTVKAVYRSDRVLEEIVLPPFHQYEIVPLEIYIIEPSPSQKGKWNRLDVDEIALTVSLNDTLNDAAPLAVQDTWNKDSNENFLYGNLDLNTAGVNSIVTADTVTPYFEVSMLQTDGSRRKIYLSTVSLKRGITQPTVTSPNPIEEYYTKGQMDALFPNFINPPGRTITLTSSNGLHRRVMGCNDDATPKDEIEDNT